MNGWQRQLLEGLQQREVLADAEYQRLATSSGAPWYMVLLTGLAAWFAALLVISAVLLLFNGTDPLGLALWGLLTLALALWLLRRCGEFAAQLALACSLIGQVLLVFAVVTFMDWSMHSWRFGALVCGVVAALMLLPQAGSAHRLLCALLVMISGVQLTASGPWMSGYSVALAALAVVLWLTRERWVATRAAGIVRALAAAATLVALVLGLFVHAQMLEMFSSQQPFVPLTRFYPAAAGTLLLVTSLWLLRHASAFIRCCAIAVILVGVVLCAQTPGLLIGAALWLAVFHACERHWSVVVGIGTTGYLGALYYSLHMTLLNKSLVLLATGLALLLLRWLLLRLWTKI